MSTAPARAQRGGAPDPGDAGGGRGERGVPIRAVGVGVPFPVLPGGRVAEGATMPLWSSSNVRRDLTRALRQEIPEGNWHSDSVHIPLGRRRRRTLGRLSGEPRGNRSDFLYVKISTGIAGALILDHDLYAGEGFRGVDIGHVGVSAAAEERLRAAGIVPPPVLQRCPR